MPKLEKAQGDTRQHLVALDRCRCGGSRYLAVRLWKRTVTFYMIHILNGKRRYLNVANVKNDMLDIHSVHNIKPRDVDALTKSERERGSHSTGSVTVG